MRTETCPLNSDDVPEANHVKMVPHSEIQMLGVPLGNDVFVADFVEKGLLSNIKSTVDRLVEFEDTQSACYLLRVSFSIVRAVHFMRTTPLTRGSENLTEQITGFRIDNHAYTQACLDLAFQCELACVSEDMR